MTPAAMQANTVNMLRDPEMTGDRLLFGVTMTQYMWWRKIAPPADRLAGRGWVLTVEEWAGQRKDWIKHLVADDIPRYEETRSTAHTCDAPMIRRDGPCGSDARLGLVRVTQLDGQVIHQRACGRHESWGKDIARKTRAAWEDAGSPSPENNTGGILARYFRGNWDILYWRANPRLMQKLGHEMPDQIREEMEGGNRVETLTPTLRLIIGGAA